MTTESNVNVGRLAYKARHGTADERAEARAELARRKQPTPPEPGPPGITAGAPPSFDSTTEPA